MSHSGYQKILTKNYSYQKSVLELCTPFSISSNCSPAIWPHPIPPYPCLHTTMSFLNPPDDILFREQHMCDASSLQHFKTIILEKHFTNLRWSWVQWWKSALLSSLPQLCSLWSKLRNTQKLFQISDPSTIYSEQENTMQPFLVITTLFLYKDHTTSTNNSNIMLWTDLKVEKYLESWESEENTKLVTQHLRNLTFSLNWSQGEVEWTWPETQFKYMPHKVQGKLEVTHIPQQYRIRPQMKPLTNYQHPKN